jgi:eukaryotic-like serine/threonine-protein kinase
MSPEQARGQTVDKRTDIWAFGCVVYEMLTGRSAFGRDTASDTIAAILERDVDVTALPSTTPPALTRVLQRCLEKDARRRLRDIGDAGSGHQQGRVRRHRAGCWVRSVTRWTSRGSPSIQPGPGAAHLVRSHRRDHRGTLGESGEYFQPRISPDGSRVAYTRPDDRTGNRDVWIVEIARAVSTRLTTHVANDWFPVWSPDGRQLLFGSDRDGGTRMRTMLKKALDATSEESPLSGVDDQPFDWSRDGKWIAYNNDDVMVAPAAGGGKAFPFLATPSHEGATRFAPDGKWIAYASNESDRFEV